MARIKGTYFGDELYGTEDPLGDHIAGRQGDDTIYCAAGNDQAWGGKGFDTIWGGLGNDYLSGGAGGDSLFGEQGFNTIYGGAGGDSLQTGYEGGFLDGGTGDDVLAFEGCNGVGVCGAGNDTVIVRLDGDAYCSVTLGPGADLVIVDQRDIGASVLSVEDWTAEDAIVFFSDDGRGSLETFAALDQNQNGQLDIGDGESAFGAVWASAADNFLIIRWGEIGTGDHVVLHGTQTLNLSEVSA